MCRFLFVLSLLQTASTLAPKPRTPTPKQPAASAETPIRSGRAPSFSSQDLTRLVQNELTPKPWLPPQLSFRTDFPKTVTAVNELKGSVKASVADLKKSVERIPIYRSAQSVARKARDTLVVRKGSAVPRAGDAQDAPAAPPRRSGRAPGLTSQDVATFVERELPSAKAKD